MPTPVGQNFQNTFDDMLSFRPGNQHRRRHDEVHAPKLLMTADVLRRNSPGPLGERLVIPGAFSLGKLPLGMSVEVSAIAGEREH